MAFSKEEKRARFWELHDQKEVIVAASAPLREDCAHLRAQQDILQQQIRAKMAEVREIEGGELAAIETEMAFLARGLGGKVGQRPS